MSQLRPDEQLAWLKRVTHNKLIDAYRKAQHRRNVNIDIFAEVLYDNDEPEQVVLQREVDRQLGGAVRARRARRGRFADRLLLHVAVGRG